MGDLRFDPITAADLEEALRLSTQAGWNQLAGDWQRLLIGCWRLCRTDDSDPLRPRLQCVQEGLFYPEDLESWEKRLAEHGVEIESRARWTRGGRSVYFRDPDGHSLELVTPGTWETSSVTALTQWAQVMPTTV